MTESRLFAISISCAVLMASSLCAEDLSKYREFQLGMSVQSVVAQAQLAPSEVKLTQQRPAVIQEVEWTLRRLSNALQAPDPVETVLFSFCDDQLFRMVITYGRPRTAGLTPEDMIAAISEQYGTATRPDAEILFPSLYNETVKVIARWEDPQYSVSLVRGSYPPNFGMVVLSKPLHATAQAAVLEASRLDQEEAPQKEIARQKRQDEADRVQQETARQANKGSFRP